MKMRNFLSVVLLLCLCLPIKGLSANGVLTLKGRIIDAESRESVPGAAIKNEATGEIFYSDLDGYFEIPVNQGQKPALKIQSLSYEEQSIQLETVPFNEVKLELQSK